MGNCCSNQILLSEATLDNSIELTLQGVHCEGKVLEVHDGDTLTLAFIFGQQLCYKSCRIEGVDCAEIRSKNVEEKKVGLEARDFLSQLVLNKIVWVEFSDKKDKYGRLLANIYPHKGGESLAKILIDKRYGYPYHGEKKQKFAEWRE